LGGLGFMLTRKIATDTKAVATKAAVKPKEPEKIESFLNVDALELEVGYGLIKLVDKKQGGDLLDRISNIRRQIATEMGLIVPPIRIRDNVQLEPNAYTLKLRGAVVAKADLMPGHLLAIDSGAVTDQVHGIETNEPAFGLAAVWIEPSSRSLAEQRNYTVVEPTSVLSTHITELIRRHAAELLTRQDVNRLFDHLKERSPKVIEDVSPDPLKVGEIQTVLQNLLKERVPIRDLETILETLADWGRRTKDPEVLSEYVRAALARTICEMHRDDSNTIHGVTLDPAVEDLVNSHVERTDRGSFLTLPPVTVNKVIAAIRNELDAAATRTNGKPPVLITAPQIRLWVRRVIEAALPQVAVLGYGEIVRGVNVRTHGLVTLPEETTSTRTTAEPARAVA
jgi:flagellar biosynthesis protein FlhA